VPSGGAHLAFRIHHAPDARRRAFQPYVEELARKLKDARLKNPGADVRSQAAAIDGAMKRAGVSDGMPHPGMSAFPLMPVFATLAAEGFLSSFTHLLGAERRAVPFSSPADLVDAIEAASPRREYRFQLAEGGKPNGPHRLEVTSARGFLQFALVVPDALARAGGFVERGVTVVSRLVEAVKPPAFMGEKLGLRLLGFDLPQPAGHVPAFENAAVLEGINTEWSGAPSGYHAELDAVARARPPACAKRFERGGHVFLQWIDSAMLEDEKQTRRRLLERRRWLTEIAPLRS
jgi:hypothetical protein